jgi:hypothetical protein
MGVVFPTKNISTELNDTPVVRDRHDKGDLSDGTAQRAERCSSCTIAAGLRESSQKKNSLVH